MTNEVNMCHIHLHVYGDWILGYLTTLSHSQRL